jgi:hypothetical protein
VKKIKTFIQACKKLGLDASKLPDVSCLPDIHQKAIIAHYKLIIIAQALNDGWQPNWNDSNQGKYYPWFEIKVDTKSPGGSGLVCSNFSNWYAYSNVGSRLCFKDWETAKYAGTTFKQLYEEYFLIS